MKKTFRQGKRPKVLVSVLNELGEGADGDVVATWHGKTVGRAEPPARQRQAPADEAAGGNPAVTLTYQGSRLSPRP